MSRIYEVTNSAGSRIGLYERPHHPKFRFVVMSDNRTVAEANNLRDAYIIYNEIAK